MRLLEHTPAPCMLCGRGNTPNADHSPMRFLDLERDINWNDPAILCEDCGTKVGVMFDLMTPDHIDGVELQIGTLKRRVSELQAEIDGMKRRAKRLGVVFETEAA